MTEIFVDNLQSRNCEPFFPKLRIEFFKFVKQFEFVKIRKNQIIVIKADNFFRAVIIPLIIKTGDYIGFKDKTIKI